MDKNCNIIRDLLPLYAEDLLSEDSRALVENHLVGCKECQRDLESIKNDIKIPTPYASTSTSEAILSLHHHQLSLLAHVQVSASLQARSVRCSVSSRLTAHA